MVKKSNYHKRGCDESSMNMPLFYGSVFMKDQ